MAIVPRTKYEVSAWNSAHTWLHCGLVPRVLQAHTMSRTLCRGVHVELSRVREHWRVNQCARLVEDSMPCVHVEFRRTRKNLFHKNKGELLEFFKETVLIQPGTEKTGVFFSTKAFLQLALWTPS